ncbi:MAG: BatD family protein [Gelidibacter sp.]
MNYFHLQILSFLLIVTLKLTAQEAKVTADKLNYKINEEIELVFEVNVEVDSMSTIMLDNFRILKGPTTSTSHSYINGLRTYTQKTTYKLIPKSVGSFEIKSPIYYTGKHGIIGDNLILSIENSVLTEKDKRIIELKKIAEKSSKPEGTLRFVVIGEVGYLEEFRDNKWEFIRELSHEDIGKLN